MTKLAKDETKKAEKAELERRKKQEEGKQQTFWKFKETVPRLEPMNKE